MRTLHPLPPPPDPPSLATGELLLSCSVPSCTARVSILLGTDTGEEAARDALCFGCVLELMAWGHAGAA